MKKTAVFCHNKFSGKAAFLTPAFIAAFLCFFLFSPSAAVAKENRYLLDITSIKTAEFPKIDIRLYFRNYDYESENGLSAGNFVLNENRTAQNINVTRLSQTISVAVIIDASLAGGIYNNLSRKIIERAALYLESLDKMAVFTFCTEMCAVNFTSDKKALTGDDSDKALDYARTPEELIVFSAEKLAEQLGKKHIIYVTASPSFINEAILENINSLKEADRPTINFLKINKPGEIVDGSFFGSIASSIASATGGVYREEALKDAEFGMSSIMNIIKSNYQLNYLSSQPYSNGRKRVLNLTASYLDTLTSCDTEYTINFNMAELNFGMGDNPVFYQEIDPAVLEKASGLGLSLSANVRFINNQAASQESTAHIGFGAFRVNGKPEELSHYIVSIDNRFNLCAAKYKFSGTLNDDYFKNPGSYRDSKENIEISYMEKQLFTTAQKNKFVKKAGIYWSPFFRDNQFNQWIRIFVSFIPDKLITDGSLRYAIYLCGKSADGREREISFDGVQLQYGLMPTVFTQDKTIYLGPEDIQKPMIQPLNPRIEYQMK